MIIDAEIAHGLPRSALRGDDEESGCLPAAPVASGGLGAVERDEEDHPFEGGPAVGNRPIPLLVLQS